MKRRLDNSVSRQLHLCLKLATKPVGLRADPDGKSGSEFARHLRLHFGGMTARVQAVKIVKSGLFF
jgi:hypothetical protein